MGVADICIPLSFDEIINEITRFTDFSEQEVKHKIWKEVTNQGWNVLQILKEKNIRKLIIFQGYQAKLPTEC